MRKLKTAAELLKHNPMQIIPALGANGFLNFVPDSVYLKWMFKAETGFRLDLRNPQTFNEKLQWLKIHDRNPLYTLLADKAAVRGYIEKLLGEQYLIPVLGIWESADDIDFGKLPDEFVLKCSHDSNSVIICRDKSNFDIDEARKKIKRRLKRNAYWGGREWPYKNISPRVIAEKYMYDENQHELTDYKFFCFGGKAEFLYVSTGLENHETAAISFFDLDWKRLPFRREDYKEYSGNVPKPVNFEKMIRIADYLSSETGAPFVRVDLYEISEKVYFSEFTFTPCCGMMPFYPPEWDMIIGSMLKLPI